MADKLNHPINLNHITPGQAIQGTIEMWTDMEDVLGKTPRAEGRCTFKRVWLRGHGYKSILYPSFNSSVSSDCFLCECAEVQWRKAGYRKLRCDYCPICWPDAGQFTPKCRSSIFDYTREPIPDILAYIQDEKNRRQMDG